MVAPPSTGGHANHGAPPTKSAQPARMNGTAPPEAPRFFPYSARRAAPLDMNTVERKGHPSSRAPLQRNRPHQLPEAPTFRPSETEFRHPMEYIRSICEEGSKFGICKIQPPPNWKPPFAIDSERFHFRTRRQEINLVEGGNRTNLNYLDQLAKFHKQYGTQLNRFPSVDKRPLDLYKLKKAVEIRGGFEKVCKDKKWAEIGRDLGYSGKIMSSLSTSLKNSYQRWLHPYEEWLKYAKSGIYPQAPFDQGPSYSPAAPPQHSPPLQIHPGHSAQSAPPTMTAPSPAVQASMALNASMEPHVSSAQPPSLPPTPTPRPVSSSGFTPVNSTGFAAINTPSGFIAVNQPPLQHSSAPPPPEVKSEVSGGFAMQPAAPPVAFAAINGSSSNSHLSDGSPRPNGHALSSSLLKRTMSHDSLNGDSGSEATGPDVEGTNGRRSKKARKDFINQASLDPSDPARSATPQSKNRSGPQRHGEKCDTCGQTEDSTNILICEGCEASYHRYCVDPPLNAMPDYEWHCPKCLMGTGEYGFEEGSVYSLKQFQEKAHNFKEHYFAQRMPFDPITNIPRRPTEDDVEREFWRLVEDIHETVEVEYGADIHSTTHGSGFPTIEKAPLDPYSRDPWNLNVMPFLEESLFRHIKGDISGMTVPWLYVGMCFSTFCWHNEDHYAYSANYQHFGATKTWYAIPGKDAYAFEDAMRKAVPELFESQPDLLFQLVTILPPDQLRKVGVEVYALDQRAGELVITFPQAYHAGFNHGFNFNEAVNFAPADWEPFGDAGVQRLREYKRHPCFSHDELLFTAAAADSTIKTAKWLAPALVRTKDRELGEREDFIARHQRGHEHPDCTYDTLAAEPAPGCGLVIKIQNTDLEEEEYQCVHCKAFTYMSQFVCHQTGKVSCLQHADITECCDETIDQRLHGPNHSLVLRYTNLELKNLVQKVVDRANVPEVWEAKVEALLTDESRPALKSMHTLLTEGEKIPYPLAGLDDLSDFVRKCDMWVDEANLYLTRKQQNRRKNEKAWRRSSVKTGKPDEKETDSQLTLERMKELIDDADQLGFSAPQVENLQEKLASIDAWREDVKQILALMKTATAEELEALLEEGRGFMATMPELTNLETLQARQQWIEETRDMRANISNYSLDECKALVKRAAELEIPTTQPQVIYLTEVSRQGDFWDIKAKEVMAAEEVHFQQLESLFSQVQDQRFPVNKDTLAQMDAILAKNREAKRQIITLVERSRDPDFRKRPMYVHVRDTLKAYEDNNGRPHGANDLEKELRRHEDWMRKGKKLFGKANAPLHILEQHMKYVEERNNYCFDLGDTFRPPVEPASREPTPMEGVERPHHNEEEKPVFCICRQPEAGLMIECEICHDWYHAKCLKLARGKVKECEMFTCPICDWRVKIPRDAARPKLEDLQNWQEELPDLPFQPEEEELLARIVDKAQGFRDFLSHYANGNQLTRTSDEMPEMLFYLRKLEGSEVLLTYETNLFRQELHKFQPIAPNPPPILEQSLSTRKPRPTKQQKLMKEHGVANPDDLPPHLRTKTYVRRKTQDAAFPTGTLMPRPSGDLSPGPGNASESPAQSQSKPDTPDIPRRSSSSKITDNPFKSRYRPEGLSSAFGGFHPSAGPSFSADTGSPLFSPTHTGSPQDGLIASAFNNRANADARSHEAFPMFQPDAGLGIDAEDDLRSGLASAEGAGSAPAQDGSSPHADSMFMEITGHENDAFNETPNLDHETSHASEALEMIRTASNDEPVGMNDAIGVDGDQGPNKDNFDDFLTTEEDQG